MSDKTYNDGLERAAKHIDHHARYLREKAGMGGLAADFDDIALEIRDLRELVVSETPTPREQVLRELWACSRAREFDPDLSNWRPCFRHSVGLVNTQEWLARGDLEHYGGDLPYFDHTHDVLSAINQVGEDRLAVLLEGGE